MKPRRRVLAIGIDAAEASLVENWMNGGVLPNLAALRSRGTFGRMSSTADWLAGSPWPTFYTGTLPGDHGFYHYLQWRPDKMEYERPAPDWIRAEPFWRRLGADRRAIAVDIPQTFPPVPFNGIEISGWASHERIFPVASFPEDRIDRVIEKFGRVPIGNEIGGPQPIVDLLNLREELISAVRMEGLAVSELIQSEEWDLLLCCFSSTHRAGHKFWDATNILDGGTAEEKGRFADTLREVYRACDGAIGEILSRNREDTAVLVFSLHGMGPNTGLADQMLPGMIAGILAGGAVSKKKGNLMTAIRNRIPLKWRSGVRGLLPPWLQDRMTAYWRMGGTDWSRTTAFNLIADLQGYVRINLKGRERNGIVEEGEAYDRLCRRLIEGLASFKDALSGDPVVERAERSDRIYSRGKGFLNLPDILVDWKFKPSAGYTRVISPEFGEIDWPMPGKNPDGRSGNHRPDGFLIVAGEGIEAGAGFGRKPHIVDLAPTILNLLGIEKPEEMKGTNVFDNA
jgi:predicted AlkP superfamily phosphohydrolase/phosphomutase